MPTNNNSSKQWVSWNNNVQHSYEQLHQVQHEQELAQAIKDAPGKVRVFGARQSSADIAAGTATLIDNTPYNKILSYDLEQRHITVQSGISLKTLMQAIQEKGWSIPCLPDIDTVTLGGALATGTHGTGREGQLLSSYMIHCRLILADGSIVNIKEGDTLMDAVRVSLGVLGIFSEITLACQPIYTLHLKEQPMKDKDWVSNYPSLIDGHEFTRVLWMPHTNHGYVILGDRIPADQFVEEKTGPNYLKHRRKVSKWLYKYTTRFPKITPFANRIIQGLFFSAEKESKGTLYDATVTKSRTGTLELAEWTIAFSRFPQLFKELKTALDDWNNPAFVHIPMDVRFVKKDNAWLSYAYGEDCVTIGCVTRDADNADYYAAFDVVEEIFLKHGGRPHWGKRFKAKNKELSQLYPQWEAFKAKRAELDPTGKFLNPYLAELFDVELHPTPAAPETTHAQSTTV